MKYSIYDYLFIYSFVSIWVLLLYHILLTIFGHKYFNELGEKERKKAREIKDFPFVSVLVPAHNEEKVIYYTVRAILEMDYPKDRFELIVINDNSSDDTGKILKSLQERYPNLKVITTTKRDGGGKGKSAALNRGLKLSRGEYIVIYDADNTPEKMALRYLVSAIKDEPQIASVCGKFRVRNKEKSLLTRFINIETLGFQWMSQAGRWRMLGLSTIPGTNFIIRRSILDKLGGWNEDAITEDTELSIRIYQLGYKIKFFPFAITWEQEPEKWSVWLKQRTRWVRGNIYVIRKFLFSSFLKKEKKIILDVFYFFSIYFLFLTSVLISDLLFILNLIGHLDINIPGPYTVLWLLAYLLYIVEFFLAVSLEKGENNLKNMFYIAVSYFTYSQAWIYLTIRSIFLDIKDGIRGQKATWYKTERF